MACEFDGTNWLRRAQAVITTVPYTMACWFRDHQNTTADVLIAFANSGSGNNLSLKARGNAVGDPVGLRILGAGGINIVTTTGFTVNQWHHACALSAATNSHAVYIDGGSKGTSVVNVVPDAGMDRTAIGVGEAAATFGPLDGEVAEAAVWDAALTDAEVAVLATGIRPIMVRPQSIVAYWPLVRNQAYDLVNGYVMTAVGGPTVSAHAPVIYGATPGLFGEGDAGPTNLYPGLSGLSGLTGLTPIMGVA